MSGDRHQSATPWHMNYIKKNVQAESIIASEPPKIFASQILVEFFVLIFADLSSVVSLICPIESLLCRLEFPVLFFHQTGAEGLKDSSGMAFWANSMATVPAEIASISLYFSQLQGIC